LQTESPVAVAELPKPAPSRVSSFLTIVEEDETFPYTFDEYADTQFTLRLVPDDQHKVFRKKHTKPRFDHGVRSEVTEWDSVADDSLAYAIVDLVGLHKKVKQHGAVTVVSIDFTTLDALEKRRYIQLLPERCQTEIIRLVVGKEAQGVDDEVAPKKS
jgi:hypothetical protein